MIYYIYVPKLLKNKKGVDFIKLFNKIVLVNLSLSSFLVGNAFALDSNITKENHDKLDKGSLVVNEVDKTKNKLVDKKHDVIPFSDFFLKEDYDTEESDEINIAKIKRFSIKPMDAEEACLQMELLNHSFYVFINSETGNVSVVYKRKNGTYGLIEPEF